MSIILEGKITGAFFLVRTKLATGKRGLAPDEEKSLR